MKEAKMLLDIKALEGKEIFTLVIAVQADIDTMKTITLKTTIYKKYAQYTYIAHDGKQEYRYSNLKDAVDRINK